mgnify:FL=1
MNGSGAHKKGSNFERDVAKAFTKWSGVKFNRTFASGAQGDKFSSDVRVTGDLFAPVDYNFPFSVECKFHDDFNLRNVFINGSVVQLFLKQNVSDARRSNRAPMLVAKVSRQDTYVVLPYTKNLENLLINKQAPYFFKRMYYQDDMTKRVYKFDMIITNLNSLLLATPSELWEWYKDLDWNYLNEDTNIIETNTDVDKLIGQVKGDLIKHGE